MKIAPTNKRTEIRTHLCRSCVELPVLTSYTSPSSVGAKIPAGRRVRWW